MGQFDYLVPGSTAAAPVSKVPVGGQFANLVPKATPTPIAPAPKAVIPLGSIARGAATLGKDTFNALTAPNPDITGPVSLTKNTSAGDDIALATINSYSNSLKDAMTRFSDAYKTISSNKTTPLEQQLSAGEAAVGALGAVFAPITAFLSGTAHIPVLGGLSTGVNNVFNAMGQPGSDALEGAVEALPVSDETKAKITPLAKEIGALATQVIAGKGTHDTFTVLTDKTHEFMGHVDSAVQGAKAVVHTGPVRGMSPSGESNEQKIPISNDYREGAPIQMGPKAADTSGLPTIKMEATASKGDLTYVPEHTVGAPAAPAVESSLVSSSKSEVTPTVEPISKEAIAPTRQEPAPVSEKPFIKSEVPTKVANDISDKLVKEGFNALTEEQKSTYTSGSYKDSAEQGRILKEQDPEALKQMAITGKNIPAGVHPHILFNIVDELAAETKDYRLQQELAKSPLGTERSQQAAGLGSSGFNKVKESPVDVIRRATKIKQGSDYNVSKVMSEGKKAKTTVDKAAVKLINYDKILESLTC